MALNGLSCAYVPLRNYSLTETVFPLLSVTVYAQVAVDEQQQQPVEDDRKETQMAHLQSSSTRVHLHVK